MARQYQQEILCNPFVRGNRKYLHRIPNLDFTVSPRLFYFSEYLRIRVVYSKTKQGAKPNDLFEICSSL